MTTERVYLFAQMAFSTTFVPRVPFTRYSGNINGRFRRASTGNMRFNASSCRVVSPDTVEVKVDAAIAPYVVYTNEPWTSPKWNGRQNPNEGWFEKATLEFARYLASAMGGKLEIVNTKEETK